MDTHSIPEDTAVQTSQREIYERIDVDAYALWLLS